MTKPPADAKVAELFEAHGQALLLYARQWADGPAAEDAVQRVFVRLLSMDRLPAEPRTWLFKCVRNEAIDAWRSDQRRRRRERASGINAPQWFVPRSQDAMDAHLAQTALAALPAQAREIIVLRIWSGLTLSQIAEITGATAPTVHKRYEAAIRSLRKLLENPCKSQKK